MPKQGIEDPHRFGRTIYLHFIIEPLFQTCQGGHNSQNGSSGFAENTQKQISPESETKMSLL